MNRVSHLSEIQCLYYVQDNSDRRRFQPPRRADLRLTAVLTQHVVAVETMALQLVHFRLDLYEWRQEISPAAWCENLRLVMRTCCAERQADTQGAAVVSA